MPNQENPTPIENIIIPDFDSNKIEIIEGINDTPIAPTNTNGSNISHVHDEHNKLVDSVISGHTELRKAIQKNSDDINYNYNYLYDRIDTYYGYNREAINNLITITSNHESSLNVNAGLINQTDGKIAAISNYLFRGQNEFEFANVFVAIADQAGKTVTLQFPKGGLLRFVYFSDIETNNHPTIYVDGNTIYESHQASSEPGYLYEIDCGYSYFPTVGSELKILLPTTYNFSSIKIKLD